MTNSEAIQYLRGFEKALDGYCELSEEGKTAFRLAVEALESLASSGTVRVDKPDKDYSSCSDCIHASDTEEVCVLRRCIHAVRQLRECYKPGKACEDQETEEREWSGLWSEPENDAHTYGQKLFEGDTIYLLGVEGTVRRENGAWGWASCNYVPWSELESRLPHHNSPAFCYCDNFISFWELKWNYDDGYDWDGVPFISHHHGKEEMDEDN